jgi:SAM-dependent methyltransferase
MQTNNGTSSPALLQRLRQPSYAWLYMPLRLANAVVKDGDIARAVTQGKFNRGWCPICESKAIFVQKGDWLRDEYFCVGCFSIPRQRALITVLEKEVPNWRQLQIHESSAGGKSSDKISAECANYSSSQFIPDVAPGETRDGVRCENLEALTFPDSSFDVFITQDVFEHILNPDRAFREVARVLRPGGKHVFTIPYYGEKPTLVRARESVGGGIEHLADPDFHGDPDEGAGWLVVTEWGPEINDFIERHAGMTTKVFNTKDVGLGLDGEFLDVFVSLK